jgi:hypothetical protein
MSKVFVEQLPPFEMPPQTIARLNLPIAPQIHHGLFVAQYLLEGYIGQDATSCKNKKPTTCPEEPFSVLK